MNPLEILETFGVPIAMCIAFGYFIWKQNKYIQDDLRRDLDTQSKRIEDIVIGLINAQKKLQTDFGRELARLEGSYRSLLKIISNIIKKDSTKK